MNRSRLAFALALLAPTLVLGGCSDDPVPKIAPPSDSPAVSGDPSPSDSAPLSAHAAQAAALRSYFASISDAISTGDPSAFLAASSGQCQNCRVLADNLKAAYAKGGHIEGGHWTVNSVKFQRKAPLGMVWNVRLHTSRERWYDSGDKLVKIVRPSSLEVGLALVSQGEDWRVRELRINS